MTIWIAFLIIVFILLSIDLTILSRAKHKTPRFKDSLKQSLIWVSVGLLFSGGIYALYENDFMGFGTNMSGKDASLQYLTGYLIELALSVDNLFVIALIMAYFKIPSQYQHKILFWGIIGVVLMRGLMITVGFALIQAFSWINYLFGAILIYSAYKMAVTDESKEVNFDESWVTRFIKKFMPVTHTFDKGDFFIKVDGKTTATTLFVALLVVESTDVLFAFDSVPAVFSVTKDPFLVFSSNIFAILGLRALYFVLASSMEKFQYLETALIAILGFIGLKMLLEDVVHIPVGISLSVVATLLIGGVVASLYVRKKHAKKKAKLEKTVEKYENV